MINHSSKRRVIKVPKKSESNKHAKLLWRIIITAVGVALILIAVSNLALYFFGTVAPAAVSTRRVGGANDGQPPNRRYEWSVHYTFRQTVLSTVETRLSARDLLRNRQPCFISVAPFSARESESNRYRSDSDGFAPCVLIFVMNARRKHLPCDAKQYRNSRITRLVGNRFRGA